MEKRKLNKHAKWKLCQAIWDICLEEKITNNDSYERHEEVARKILGKHPEISIDMLKIFDDWMLAIRFFNGKRKYVQFEKLSWTEEISSNMFAVLSITQTIKNVLNNHKPAIIHYEKPKRMASPPLSAYEPVPVSKLDIKHSEGSYALLFDPYL